MLGSRPPPRSLAPVSPPACCLQTALWGGGGGTGLCPLGFVLSGVAGGGLVDFDRNDDADFAGTYLSAKISDVKVSGAITVRKIYAWLTKWLRALAQIACRVQKLLM